ncbi:hypothetical protein GG344DRAFT_69708 [Lentinula edodes]|nr:hypothetical protein GG344DRAFT_69708 [Lentinula edodes]
MSPAPSTPSMQDIVPLLLNDVFVHTDLEPLVYEEWSQQTTDNLKNATDSTMPRIALVESALCALLAKDGSSFFSGDGMNSVVPQQIMALARARTPFDTDDAYVFSSILMESHPGDALPKSLLRWFELVAPELLVPRVLAVDDMGELTVTTFVPGLDAMHAYLCLDVLATEHSVLSYAQLTVRMFRIPAPQCFGTSEDLNGPTLLQVVGSHIRFSLEHCFEVSESTDLQSFFDGLIDSRLLRSSIYHKSNPARHSLSSLRLAKLRERIQSLIVEPQAYLPALYLQTQGREGTTLQFCVKGLYQRFWNCLVLGTRLRDAYTWITLSNGDLIDG